MNMMASDGISFDRSVPDIRMQECQYWNYPSNLPKVEYLDDNGSSYYVATSSKRLLMVKFEFLTTGFLLRLSNQLPKMTPWTNIIFYVLGNNEDPALYQCLNSPFVKA